MISPYEGGKFRVTSIIGYRNIPELGYVNNPHYGLDIVGLSSKNIIAIKSGKVVTSQIITNKSNATWQWGNYVCVYSDDGLYTYYCHMSKRSVSVGDIVNVGDIIGVEGATGQVTGSHLHLEIRNGTIKCRLPASANDICNVATILGIQNATGTYTVGQDVIETKPISSIPNATNSIMLAIDRLVKYNIINTPQYWYDNYSKIAHLDLLLIRAASSIRNVGKAKLNVLDAIDALFNIGLINTPQYWRLNYISIPYLDILLMRLGGCTYIK